MAKPQSRRHCITSKIPSDFGSMYSHIDIGSDGKIIGIRFSAPGKFNDSELMELMILLADTATADIRKAQGIE